MSKKAREEEIYEYLEKNGYTSVKVLSEKLFSSESSIRRDLSKMESLGLVRRSYGGAQIITARSNVLPFEARSYEAVAEKRRIAQKAVSLIKDGDVVFLDQSSTSYFLATEIAKMSRVTVMTNNLEILMLLSRSGVEAISTGGMTSRNNPSCLVGPLAVKSIEGIFADVAFFSVKALSDDGALSDCALEEIYVRSAMLKNAERRVFLCDSTKIGRRASYKQCTLAEIDTLVCDSDATRKFKKDFPELLLL